MKKKDKVILMDHGSGGYRSEQLIRGHILPALGNPLLDRLGDGAVFDLPVIDGHGTRLAFTTDSYVVDPIFFPGGSIGSLSVNGTVNDLAMCGAKPLYLSSAFIIEEGFPVSDLDLIISDMAKAAERANIKIVTGDTKVVAKGAADKIFITTSGIGVISGTPFCGQCMEPGDKIIISGTIADHGIAILATRANMELPASISSDTAPLCHLVEKMIKSRAEIRLLRDPTRGGLATILNEIAENAGTSIRVDEEAIPVRKEVSALCSLLGIDPLYVANEGKLVAVVAAKDAEKLVALMRNHEMGQNVSVIGEVSQPGLSKVIMKTRIGGERIIPMLTGEQLPRIC
ncbi:hydrogenase expression/formation protein HypE [Desulforegula conservatrix]|uniref:hydrogenase expression/formation protein HypE n=1 Tax=Desulforegula conservatrix TaxID=153026 RepID=UPI00041A9482|nr:hydrogenase expression/formation protein HypE [Desulforegula conservatrix]